MAMPAGGEVGLRALERGLSVIRAFSHRDMALTISELAQATGYDRAVVRRILGTLERLGYVGSVEGRFSLRASVLELGYSYLSSNPLPRIADERLHPFAHQVAESCSLGVLERWNVIFLARAHVERISGPSLTVGTSAEPYTTSIGRVLLASLDDDTVDRYLQVADLRPLTPYTIAEADRLRAEIEQTRDRGWCLVDQELELGVIAVAVPVHDRRGQVVAGVNVTTHSSRSSADKALVELLPPLHEVADLIEQDLLRTAQ